VTDARFNHSPPISVQEPPLEMLTPVYLCISNCHLQAVFFFPGDLQVDKDGGNFIVYKQEHLVSCAAFKDMLSSRQ
jgi:hypothetical protein